VELGCLGIEQVPAFPLSGVISQRGSVHNAAAQDQRSDAANTEGTAHHAALGTYLPQRGNPTLKRLLAGDFPTWDIFRGARFKGKICPLSSSYWVKIAPQKSQANKRLEVPLDCKVV